MQIDSRSSSRAFMFADGANSVFSVHTQEPYSVAGFLISGLEKTRTVHFAGIKSEVVTLENVIHFAQKKAPYCPNARVWPPQILKKKSGNAASGRQPSRRGAVLGAEVTGDWRAGVLLSPLRFFCCNTG